MRLFIFALSEKRIQADGWPNYSAARLQGMHLEIRDGKIMKIHTGSCQASGEIAIEGKTFYKKKPAALQLPGTIDLEPGVPIQSDKDVSADAPL
jgi:hypothetical protein